MTVLDLIKKSSIMLNIREVLQDSNLSDINETNQDELLNTNFALNRLYEFVKVMLNEIASSYLPIVREVETKTEKGKIPLTVCEKLSRLVGVKREDCFTRYSIQDDNIVLKEDGEYTVVYNQYPMINSLLDDVNVFDEKVGEDVLIYGLNSYYCLATGLFEEFNVYNENYVNKLSKLKNLKLFSMRCRSWVW